MQETRVRFAPSPTGPLHIGGVRTALYNYLFAKKNNGTFILRIEDTDASRFVPKAEEYIKESLDWAGIEPDESPWNPGEFGPYTQTERKHIYKQYAEKMVEDGNAYYAFDTPEALDEIRELSKKTKVPNWQYNHITRNTMQNSLTLGSDEVKQRIDQGIPHVIRIKIPRNEEIRFEDEIRGWVTVNSSNIDDKVIFKSDGMPTYHLANVVDDYLMKISHVIRGEEWLPSAPVHILLYTYLNWGDKIPKFAHLPLILKPEGNGKLSKRDGDRLGFPVFPLNWLDEKTKEISIGYKERGYLPSAFDNMLALLGWHPEDNQEIFSREELIQAFTLERVNKSGAKFDINKAKWFQQEYLRAIPNEKLAELIRPKIKEIDDVIPTSIEQLPRICGLMKERSTFETDIINEGIYFFTSVDTYDQKIIKKKWKEKTPRILADVNGELKEINQFTAKNIELNIAKYMKDREMGFGQVGPPLRLALTGKGMGPSLYDIIEILGKKESMLRIENAIQNIT